MADPKVYLPMLKTPQDVFVCVPYGGPRIFARACVLRQLEVKKAHRPGMNAPDHLRKCLDCPLGRHVASCVGEQVEKTPPPSQPVNTFGKRRNGGLPRARRTCSLCGVVGHDRRYCPRETPKPKRRATS